MTRKQKRALKRATVVQVSFLRIHAHDWTPWYEFPVQAASSGDLHAKMIAHLKTFFEEDLVHYLDKIRLQAIRFDNERPRCSCTQQETIILRLV